MNKAEFTDLIINPDKLGNEHIDTLKKIVADYPYFSTAQILLSKALLNTNHYEYEKQLKTTALSVINREVLNQFLNNISEEIESEISIMHLSDQLKAEKVSKPDFEAGKLEQDALLIEAQNIISKNEIPTSESPLKTGNLPENTTELVEEKIESVTDNFDFTEPILENIVNEITVTETELTIDQEIENENVSLNIPELADEIVENITDNFDYSEPILETIVNEIPVIETINIKETAENETENNTETDFHLAETEGILVKYVNAEAFLPDFDEASLFADEQNIETITKSVLPNVINNNISTPEIEPEIIENIEELSSISEDSIIESFTTDNVEDVLTDSESIVESNNISLENILAIELENINIPIETTVNKDFEVIEELVLVTEMANAETTLEVANLNFLEWLTINKKKLVDENAEIAKPQETNYYEDEAFVTKIKQIIKSKAENDLSKNIITGIEIAHDNSVPFERKNNIPDSIEETVEKIEIANNILEEINIESFAEPIETIIETNNDNDVYHSNKILIETHHNYNTEVESILPDFEALKALPYEEEKSYIIFDKKEGLIPNYETPVFDPLFNSHFETKPTIADSVENEILVDFNNYTIDNNLFENSFSSVYIPLPAKETETLPTNETINVKSESSKNEIDNILDKFMRENPSISRPKTEFFNPATVAKTSAEEKDEIVSETLASIYLNQGLIKKSILTYEKLCLIYPHKNAYFAALINKIKTEHNIN